MRPYGQQPTRLLCPQDSLGKNTGVGCHFLLLCVHQFSSVQFSHSVVSDSSRPHELQHARPPCPSPTPGVHSNSHPYMTTGKTIALTRRTFVGKVISLLFNMLSRLGIYVRSDQISHSVVSDSLQPHESQHARPPCPSPTPGVYSDSCPLNR